jgi:hypothetical protein
MTDDLMEVYLEGLEEYGQGVPYESTDDQEGNGFQALDKREPSIFRIEFDSVDAATRAAHLLANELRLSLSVSPGAGCGHCSTNQLPGQRSRLLHCPWPYRRTQTPTQTHVRGAMGLQRLFVSPMDRQDDNDRLYAPLDKGRRQRRRTLLSGRMMAITIPTERTHKEEFWTQEKIRR